jgi:hypothetical protein
MANLGFCAASRHEEESSASSHLPGGLHCGSVLLTTNKIVCDDFAGVVMSIATEILSLRRDQTSSVNLLIGAISWEKAAQRADHRMARHAAVLQFADLVLLNVAVHAGETLSQPPTTHRTRRGVLPYSRKRRRSDPGQLHQHRLFV